MNVLPKLKVVVPISAGTHFRVDPNEDEDGRIDIDMSHAFAFDAVLAVEDWGTLQKLRQALALAEELHVKKLRGEPTTAKKRRRRVANGRRDGA